MVVSYLTKKEDKVRWKKVLCIFISCCGEEDEEKTIYPQLGCGHLFIEKNKCPNRTKRIYVAWTFLS